MWINKKYEYVLDTSDQRRVRVLHDDWYGWAKVLHIAGRFQVWRTPAQRAGPGRGHQYYLPVRYVLVQIIQPTERTQRGEFRLLDVKEAGFKWQNVLRELRNEAERRHVLAGETQMIG